MAEHSDTGGVSAAAIVWVSIFVTLGIVAMTLSALILVIAMIVGGTILVVLYARYVLRRYQPTARTAGWMIILGTIVCLVVSYLVYGSWQDAAAGIIGLLAGLAVALLSIQVMGYRRYALPHHTVLAATVVPLTWTRIAGTFTDWSLHWKQQHIDKLRRRYHGHQAQHQKLQEHVHQIYRASRDPALTNMVKRQCQHDANALDQPALRAACQTARDAANRTAPHAPLDQIHMRHRILEVAVFERETLRGIADRLPVLCREAGVIDAERSAQQRREHALRSARVQASSALRQHRRAEKLTV